MKAEILCKALYGLTQVEAILGLAGIAAQRTGVVVWQVWPFFAIHRHTRNE